MFENRYTFFLVGQKVKSEDIGRLFSSNIQDKGLGWNNGDKSFHLNKIFAIIQRGTAKDTDLHCFKAMNNNGYVDFWDFNERMNILHLAQDVTIDSSITKQLFYVLIILGR